MSAPRLSAIILAFAFASSARASTALPCEFHDGLIWVKVSAPAGRAPLDFVLDSGAGRTVLDLSVARRLGLPMGRSQPVQGADGSATAFAVREFSASVGAVSFHPAPLAMDLSVVSKACGHKIDGLLGVDFFRDRLVRIDYRHHLVSLLSRSEAATTASEPLRLALRGDAMCVEASVDQHPLAWMRVDTGCDTALHWVSAPSAVGGSAKATAAILPSQQWTTITSVQIGSTTIPGVKTSLHATPMFRGEAGLLGNGLWSDFVLTFDLAHSHLWLSGF